MNRLCHGPTFRLQLGDVVGCEARVVGQGEVPGGETQFGRAVDPGPFEPLRCGVGVGGGEQAGTWFGEPVGELFPERLVDQGRFVDVRAGQREATQSAFGAGVVGAEDMTEPAEDAAGGGAAGVVDSGGAECPGGRWCPWFSRSWPAGRVGRCGRSRAPPRSRRWFAGADGPFPQVDAGFGFTDRGDLLRRERRSFDHVA